MNKPTKAQVRGFWEGCGLKWFWNHNPECQCGAKDDDDSRRSWYYKDGEEWKRATRFWYDEMPVGLNELFRYAAPRLKQDQYYKALSSIFYYDVIKDDPALALFWACYPVITGKEVNHE